MREKRVAVVSKRYKTLNITKVAIKGQVTSTFIDYILQSQLSVDNH